MGEGINKRKFTRYPLKAPFIFSDKKKEYYYGGMIQNFSKGGIFFKSGRSLEPGTLILTMRETTSNFYEYYRPDMNELSRSDRTSNRFLAEVRWCKKVDGDKKSCFGVGIRYFNVAGGQVK